MSTTKSQLFKAVEMVNELNNEDLRFDFDIKSIVQFDAKTVPTTKED